MHWANLRASDCSLCVRFELNVPGGWRSLQAVVARFHTAGVTLTPYSNSFLAFGSGKSATPCARMHSANLTAFSRADARLGLAVGAAWAGSFEPQPPPLQATKGRAARAIGRVTPASLDSGWGPRGR